RVKREPWEHPSRGHLLERLCRCILPLLAHHDAVQKDRYVSAVLHNRAGGRGTWRHGLWLRREKAAISGVLGSQPSASKPQPAPYRLLNQRQLVRSQIAQFSYQFDLWNSQNLLGIKDTWLQESCLDIHFKPGPLHTRGVSYYRDQHPILGIGWNAQY